MNSIIQLKQTPFIAVVLPEGASEISMTSHSDGIIFKLHGRIWEQIDLEPGTKYSIVIPSVRKATEEEAEQVVEKRYKYDEEENPVEAIGFHYYDKDDSVWDYVDTAKESLHSLMTASMPEGLLWVNPERKPVYCKCNCTGWYNEHPCEMCNPEGSWKSVSGYFEKERRWHSAQSKVVGDAVILKQG